MSKVSGLEAQYNILLQLSKVILSLLSHLYFKTQRFGVEWMFIAVDACRTISVVILRGT